MSGPSSTRSERSSIAIALIGGLATIIAALIGVAANSNNSRADREAGSDKPSSRASTEQRQPTIPVTHVEPGKTTTIPSPARVAPSTAPEQKRLAITYRKAGLPGHGVVIGLTNATEKETLKNMVVFVKSPTDPGERSFRVARSLRPRETISVGWKELDGWKLNPGDRVKIKFDGDSTPIEVVIPKL